MCLNDAAMYAECFDNDAALVCIRDMIQVGIECFGLYGVPTRQIPDPFLNARDGLPA
jgi:hypothetical protein